MQLARRRLRVARYSIGAVALSAFAAVGFAVRDAHPATHTSSAAAATVSSGSSSLNQSSPSVAISPAPQTVAPLVQSGGS
jgi:hypothetical protein